MGDGCRPWDGRVWRCMCRMTASRCKSICHCIALTVRLNAAREQTGGPCPGPLRRRAGSQARGPQAGARLGQVAAGRARAAGAAQRGQLGLHRRQQRVQDVPRRACAPGTRGCLGHSIGHARSCHAHAPECATQWTGAPYSGQAPTEKGVRHGKWVLGCSPRPHEALCLPRAPGGSAQAAALASTAASCATLGRQAPARKRPSWRSARPRSAGGSRANSSSIIGLRGAAPSARAAARAGRPNSLPDRPASGCR